MKFRFDKVTRKLPLGFMKVYSLVVNDGGLYILRTGDVGGLQPNEGKTPCGPISSAVAQRYVERLREGEEQLGRKPLRELASEKGNSFVPFSQIKYVDVLRNGELPQMRLRTEQGSFTFLFSDTPEGKMEELERMLRDTKN